MRATEQDLAAVGQGAAREDDAACEDEGSQELGDAVDRIVFNRYRLAAVVVDARFEVLRFHGRTGFYLEPAAGGPNLNVIDMARPGLGEALSQLLAQALREDAPARREHVPVEGAHGLDLVSVEVIPVKRPGTSAPHLLVLFARASAPPLAADARALQPEDEREVDALRARVTALDAAFRLCDLEHTAALGEASAANEELRVANEELRTINVELCDNRQELQLTAEELQHRNVELGRTNDTLGRAIRLASAARDRAAALFETVPLPLVMVDETLRIEVANRAFHEFFGLPPLLEPSCRLPDLSTDEASRFELRAQLCAAFERRAWPGDFELEYRLARGGVQTILFCGSSVESERGAPALLLLLLDVTEHKRREHERVRFYTEAAQRFLNEAGRLLLAEPLESESMLYRLARFAVPQLGDLCLIDLVGDDRGIRPAAAARAGSAEPPSLEAIAARIAPDTDVVVAEVVRTGSSAQGALDAPTVEQALGRERHAWLRRLGACSYLCVPLTGRRGVLGALTLARTHAVPAYGREELGLAEGLAQRVGLALENAQLYRTACEVISVRDEFMGIAAHELRTPLTALGLQLETLRALLKREARPSLQAGRVREKVERALTQIARLGRLIDSLLVASRISAGKLALQCDEVDLSEVVRDVAQRLRADAERTGSSLEVRAAEPVVGFWDALRLEQLVTNLLSNALRHAPGRPVSLWVEADEQRARLQVQDRGPGIPPERCMRIFERFETAGAPHTSGLGLGLYVARQIAEAHGGTISVHSELGSGATFTVELPRTPAGRRS